MEIVLIILLIITLAVAIICIVGLSSSKKKIKELSDQTDVMRWENKELQSKYVSEQKSNLFLQEQLATSLSNNANAEEKLNAQYDELNNSIAAAEIRLKDLNAQLQERTNEFNTVAAAFKELDDKANETRAQNIAAASELNSYKVELQQIIKELDDAKETKRSLTLNAFKNEQNWFDFDLSNKEIKLIATIAEISGLYPELIKDMATIEWKKIWLPKFQDLANTNGLMVRGIYRLVLKNDENISYVGQAVNIKERWYEHAKKMIGADAKGAEKLYRYRPEDFYWTVLETNTSDLNSAERYWIEYYCCKEVGLNKK